MKSTCSLNVPSFLWLFSSWLSSSTIDGIRTTLLEAIHSPDSETHIQRLDHCLFTHLSTNQLQALIDALHNEPLTEAHQLRSCATLISLLEKRRGY